MTTIRTMLDRDHVLLRPGMYIGNTHMVSERRPLLIDGSIVEEEIAYNPGLERLFLEVFYNALDNCERSVADGVDPGKISVLVKEDTVVVKNEGNPFPVGVEDEEGIYAAERGLGIMRSGSNFDSGGRQVGGTNGCGSKAANIFSLVFEADICNGVEGKRLILKWKNNMTLTSKELSDYEGPSYTKIRYVADFARFYDTDVEFDIAGKRRYNDEMIHLFGKHCVDGALTAGVPVVFNGRVIQVPDIKSYARFFYPDIDNLNTMSLEAEGTKCLLVDPSSSMIGEHPNTHAKTVTFVNGICVRTGVHVEAWQKKIVEPLLPIFKRMKLPITARNAYKHVFGRMTMILVCRYDNIEFSEQVKDKLISPKPELSPLPTLPIVKWECIRIMAQRMLAVAGSLENITKKNDGKKSTMCGVAKLSDALKAGGKESQLCKLYICEGQSASALAEKYVDGMYCGVLPLQGKPINVSKCSKEDYEANDEIIALNQAFGFKEGTDYSDDKNFAQLRYGMMITLTDQDVDGAGHIVGLIINYLRKRHPTLLERKPSFLRVFETPLLKAIYAGEKYNFFSSHDYKEWLREKGNPPHKCEYLKGLGSNDDGDIEEAFESGRITEYKWDDNAEEMMSMAFDKEEENERKDWVLSWDTAKGLSSRAEEFEEDSVSYFVSSHLCEYSYTNTQRSIPSLVDSMKECNRKILSVAMKFKDPIAVTDFKGKVKTKTSYKYGDESLYRAIVVMANVCVGTNNINVLRGKGQFDSRKGATAAKDRYIKAGPSKVLPYIFREEDTILLERKRDEGKEIEPHHYYPIVPLFAINGVSGIGTGFACKIPAHHPMDIIKWISWWLKRHTGDEVPADPPVLKPHYNNYKGRIFQKKKGWYSEGAYEEIPSRKRVNDIRITELPITLTIKSYITKLEGIIARLPNKVLFKSSASSIKYTYKGEKRIEIVPNITISGFVSQKESYLKELGLIEKIPLQSIVLLDENSHPKIYGSDLNAALSDYCMVRYKAYERRREALIDMWNRKIDNLELKKRYVAEVVDGSISFRVEGRPTSKVSMIREISSKGYPEEFLKMSMDMLTIDGLASIEKEISGFREKIEVYENTTPRSLWADELRALAAYLYK
jgi:DNA topoisomerase-2